MIPGNIATSVAFTSRGGFALENEANIIIHSNGAITTTNTVTSAEFIGPIAYANSAGTAEFSNLAAVANFSTLAATANYAVLAANANYSANSGFALIAEDANHSNQANFATLAANANYSLNAGNAIAADTANLASTANVAILAGHVTDPSQPNITMIGTLSSLTVSSDIIGGNVYANSGTIGAGLLVGPLAPGSQPNITSLGNLSNLYVAGPATIEGALLVSDDTAITGNLTISGNLNYTSSNNLSIQSPIIEVGGGPNGAPLTTNDGQDRGLYMHVFDSNVSAEVNKFMGWDTSVGEFRFVSNATISNNVITTNEYGNIRANIFYGNFTGNVTGVAANAIHAQVADVANSVAGANVVGDVVGADHANVSDLANSVAGVNVTGIVANANYSAFSGTASTANSVAGANVTGEVAHAAVANSVAAANIVGTVANANYSTFSGVAASANSVAGANVTGEVSFAAVANSVAGANIVGIVANANYSSYSNIANTANSVAGANVTGTVANANYAAYSGTTSQLANGTSSVTIPVADGNVEVRVNGTMVIDSNDIQTSFLANTVSVNYDLTAGNHIYANSLEASGNITATSIEAYGSLSTAFFTASLDAQFYENVGVGANLSVGIDLEVTGAANIGANLTVNADSDLVGNVTVGEELYVNNNLTVMNLIQSNTLSVAADANLGVLNVSGLSNLGDIANVTITGGSNAQILSTDGLGNLSWTNPGLNYKYTKEWHVDPVNGNNTTGDGSYNKPFATIARAITATGPSYAQAIYLHAGTYSENVTIVSPAENIDIIGVNDTSTCLCTGTWAFSHTGTSIRVLNIRFNGAITQTSTGDVYFDNCLFTASFVKSGASYTEFNSCSVTAASFTSNAITVARNGSITGLTLNNAGARVYVYNMISVLTTTVTAGQFYAFDTVLYSATTTANAVTASAGTIVSLIRCNVTNASGTVSRMSLAGNYSINDVTYDLANSTLTGTNLGTVSYFDALNARGNIAAGNISLSGTGTALNVSSGNILTNQITGTRLNLLNGVYTVGITGGSANANYTLGLPANGGTNGQVLSSNGANGTVWTNSIQSANLANTVTVAAQPNITSVGTLTGLTVDGNIIPTPSTNRYLGNFGNQWAFTLTQALGSSNTDFTISSYGENVGASNVGRNILIAADGGGLQSGVNGGDITLYTSGVDVGSGNSGNINLETGYIDSGTRGVVNVIADHLNVLNPMTVSGTSNLGAVGNVIITGGSNGQVLTTDGTGTLSWSNVSANSLINGNSNVVVEANSNVSIGVAGSANRVVVSSTGANIAGNVAITGNITAANLGNISSINLTGSNSNVLYGNGVFASIAAGSYGDSNVVTLLGSFGSNSISTTGNITTGLLTVSTGGGDGGADEGGEIRLAVPTANTTLIDPVKVDVYQDRFRIFSGSTRGVYVDLTQADLGVGTLLNNRVSGYANAGTFVTMDNLKVQVTSSGNRGLSLASVSGTFSAYVSVTFSEFSGGSFGAGTQLVVTTTPSASLFGYNFISQGDTSTYIINDITNSRCYRVTLMIGGSYNNNVIVIERLI